MAKQPQLVEATEVEEVNEEAIDVVEIIGDTVSVIAGAVAGASVGYGLNKVLPVAETIAEKAMRGTGIASATLVTQWLTSSALSDDIHETREAISLVHRLASNGKKKLSGKKDNN